MKKIQFELLDWLLAVGLLGIIIAIPTIILIWIIF